MQDVRDCGDWMTTAPCDYASSDTDAPFLSNRLVNRNPETPFRIIHAVFRLSGIIPLGPV